MFWPDTFIFNHNFWLSHYIIHYTHIDAEYCHSHSFVMKMKYQKAHWPFLSLLKDLTDIANYLSSTKLRCTSPIMECFNIWILLFERESTMWIWSIFTVFSGPFHWSHFFLCLVLPHRNQASIQKSIFICCTGLCLRWDGWVGLDHDKLLLIVVEICTALSVLLFNKNTVIWATTLLMD